MALFGRLVWNDEAELGAVVENRDWPKDGLYSDRVASLVVYIQPFENRSVR